MRMCAVIRPHFPVTVQSHAVTNERLLWIDAIGSMRSTKVLVRKN